ncbi:PTS sugar transporter subunit IIB [Actinomycetaceae bacterium MB13-C1-2]|nr:PTS sugar transporter subunit IIB [Actinomycetaceae bacterium MB13-C1-2]
MSDQINIFICCGAGASSGFIAQKARQAAKARGWENVEVIARSEAELDENLPNADVVLLGPHLEYMIDDARRRAAAHEVRVALIPQSLYGTMDGAGILDLAADVLEAEDE